ncbi:MAG TPA: glycosyltransferase family 9 protein [Ktedonobacterales bacterium]
MAESNPTGVNSTHGSHTGGDPALARYETRPGFEARLAARGERAAKGWAKSFVWLAVGAVGFLTRTRRADSPELRAGNPDVKRILVTRVDLLGDVVLSLPAVRALRRAYPHARIEMLVLGATAGILEGQRGIDRVLTFDPYFWRSPAALLNPATWRQARKLLTALRGARYDLAISISGDIASILTRLSGARRRVGYSAEAYPFMLTDPLPGGRYRVRKHEVRYVLALAEAAGGIVAEDDALLALAVLPDAARQMAEQLRGARRRTGAGGPLVAIHAGARNGQAKRWPPERIAALAERLVRELDALVVLTGAPSERVLAEAVLRRCEAPVADLVGRTDLPRLVALLAASDVLVTGDSGPLHVAGAVRTPVVALHGPTDPALSGPTAPDAIVLRHALWCAPCYDASATAECRFSNPVCMKGIAPDAVFAAVVRQLRRRGRELPRILTPDPSSCGARGGQTSSGDAGKGDERHARQASHP